MATVRRGAPPAPDDGPRVRAALVARLTERAARYPERVAADDDGSRPGAHFRSPWPDLADRAGRGEPVTIRGYVLRGIVDVPDPGARYTVDSAGAVAARP